MSELFNALPDGCHHLERFLDTDMQIVLVKMSRELLKGWPLCQPTTKAGYPLSLKVSSWGRVGWFAQDGKYEYIRKHPVNGRWWPDIPITIKLIVQKALRDSGFPPVDIDTVLLNWYPATTGKLGRHQDVTEEDHTSPIVTISLGDTCLFNIGDTDYESKGRDVILMSGDVFVMGLESRLAYHGVKKLLPDSSDLLPNGGRISLTARKVFK